MRTSVVTYEQCVNEVDNFLNKHNGNVYVKKSFGNCAEFPLPEEFDDWNFFWEGYTPVIYVYDAYTDKELFACAYCNETSMFISCPTNIFKLML